MPMYNVYTKQPSDILAFLQVTGYVVDSEGTFKWFITGTWDEKIEACRVTSQSMRAGKPVYETGPPKVLWKRNPIV